MDVYLNPPITDVIRILLCLGPLQGGPQGTVTGTKSQPLRCNSTPQMDVKKNSQKAHRSAVVLTRLQILDVRGAAQLTQFFARGG